MNLDDRIKRELRERASSIDVEAAGPRSIIGKARYRTRRARLVGGAAACVLVIGVGGIALALRDNDQAQIDTEVAAVGGEPATGEGSGLTDGSETARPAPADAGATAGEDSPAPEVATTEQEPGSEPVPTDSTEDREGEAPRELDNPGPDELASLSSAELISHSSAFISIQSDRGSGLGATLWSTTDGSAWAQIADPKPTPDSSITHIASYNGLLYAAGDRPEGAVSRPWVAVSPDLSSWRPLEVTTPAGDGSGLTDTYTRLYSLAAGPAGVLVTGETITDLRVAALVDPDVVSSESWSLGDSSGDLSKLVVYDSNGDVDQELDLAAEGVPQTTIDDWTDGNPNPFVAVARAEDALVPSQVEIETGALLLDAAVKDTFLASGLSRRVSSLIIWESTDGVRWAELPVGALSNAQADVLGHIGDRLVVFASDGPVLAVQYRDGQEWTEHRLDDLFATEGQHRVVDATFHSTGAAAVIETTDPNESSTLWLLHTDDGATWVIEPLADVLSGGDPIIGVESLAMSAGSIAIGTERTGDLHQVNVVSR